MHKSKFPTHPDLIETGCAPDGHRRASIFRLYLARHDRRRFHRRAAFAASSEADRPVARSDVAHSRGARTSGAQAAAGDPCRRHQRQGLDHRLHARDPRGGGAARACLYLAASRAFQRTLPAGTGRRWRARNRRGTRGGAAGMRGGQWRRADHGVRDRDGGGLSSVLAPSGRCAAARGRARRPARRDQCDRARRSRP